MYDKILSSRNQGKLLLDTTSLWRRAYMLVIGPAIIILCVLTGPFQVPDERSHFLRVVQIASGSFLPVLSPDGKLSGAAIDEHAVQLSEPYKSIWYNQGRKFSVPQLQEMAGIAASPNKIFVDYEIVIYFPLAYLVPAAAVALTQIFDLHPLIWFYAGRFANSIVAIALICFVLSRIRHARPAMFVIAALPMAMFETASLSPDALLYPVSMVFAWVLAELIDQAYLSPRSATIAAAAGFFLAMAKFVYLPFAVIAPIGMILRQRRVSFSLAILIGGAFVSASVWAAWTHAVSGFVLPHREGMIIDVKAQAAYVMGHPFAFMQAILNTLRANLSYFPATMIGRHLGWGEIKIPPLVIGASVLALLLGLTVDDRPWRPNPAISMLLVLGIACSILGIFLSLYLGFSPVGADHIDGIQGRYFLPLLPFLAIALPKWRPSGLAMEILFLAVIAWGLTSAVTTVAYVTLRYWTL